MARARAKLLNCSDGAAFNMLLFSVNEVLRRRPRPKDCTSPDFAQYTIGDTRLDWLAPTITFPNGWKIAICIQEGPGSCRYGLDIYPPDGLSPDELAPEIGLVSLEISAAFRANARALRAGLATFNARPHQKRGASKERSRRFLTPVTEINKAIKILRAATSYFGP